MEQLGPLGCAGCNCCSIPLHRAHFLVCLFHLLAQLFPNLSPDALTTAAAAAWVRLQCTELPGCPLRNTINSQTATMEDLRRHIPPTRWRIKLRARRSIQMMDTMVTTGRAMGESSYNSRRTCIRIRRGRFMKRQWDHHQEKMGSFTRRNEAKLVKCQMESCKELITIPNVWITGV